MKTSKLKTLTLATVIVLSSVLLSACGKKTKTQSTKTPNTTNTAAQTFEFKAENRPYISLIPRSDGHQLKLKIERIPSNVTQLDYEVLYTAQDNGLEIEKGVGDTIKNISSVLDRDILLGTESCTSGCKYKYDEGITSGTLTLTFTTKDNQTSTFETPFVLKSSEDLKKEKSITLTTENFTVNATTSTKDFFILIKNLGTSDGSKASTVYSVFASSTGAGKVSSITPNTVTKTNTSTLAGDYLTL